MSHAHLIERLKKGEAVVGHRESGNSMMPLIHHRQPVTISPVDASKLEPGDIVFCKVHGRFYTHLVKATSPTGVQIGNNRGGINGWAPHEMIFGIISAVDGVPRRSAETKIRR